MRYSCLVVVSVLALQLVGCGLRPAPGDKASGSDSLVTLDQRDLSLEDLAKESREGRAEDTSAIRRLAAELTDGKSGDKEKVYAIYRWLAENIEYNTDALRSGDLGDNTASTVLRTKTGVCEGYSRLFISLCEVSGIESAFISGWTHMDATDLLIVQGDGPTHAWNAVKIDGKWRLLDPTWGAGSVSRGMFEHAPSDDWFLVKPSRFVYSHFPEHPGWQLLKKKIGKDDFDQKPDLRPRFFSQGLSLTKRVKRKMHVHSELDIELKNSGSKLVSGLVLKDEEKIEGPWTWNSSEGGRVFIQARFPEPGDYELAIMTREPGDAKSLSVGRLKIEVESGSRVAFPEKLLGFDEHQVEVVQGLESPLSSRDLQNFEFRIPQAHRAFLKVDGELLELEKTGSDQFSSKVKPKGPEIVLFANFDEASRDLKGLLKYEVGN